VADHRQKRRRASCGDVEASFYPSSSLVVVVETCTAERPRSDRSQDGWIPTTMTSEEKRIIVSGLTHTISISDLTNRFSAFGVVKAVDGLGKLDALGQPRKYAFVTLESTPAMHAKCTYTSSISCFWSATNNFLGFNLLSGTIWKGTKLRLGEAKPDYAERYTAACPIPNRLHTITRTSD